MNCHLPHISNIITKWILCFYSERENMVTDTILCDNLEDMNLVNVFTCLSEDTIKKKMLNEFKIEDYDAANDPLKVLEPKIKGHSNDNTGIDNEYESMEGIETTGMECSYDNSVVENKSENVSVKRDDPKDGGYKYRTIQIPVTKPLFMKVVNLKTDSDVKLADYELYIIICHLLTFLHNKTPLLQTLAQQLLDDSELCSRLSVIDKQQTEKNRGKKAKHSKNMPFRQELENAICEVENCIGIFTTDKFGNAAIAGRDSNSRPLVYTDVYSLCYFFKPHYIRMDGYFLICNHKLLCEYYENISPGFGLTLDIDFSDIFYGIAKNSTSEKDSIKKVTEQLNEALQYEFFAITCLRVCLFRLAGVQINLNFKSISNKQLHIYYKECIFNERTQLPLNLKVLSITESKINCDLTLPDTLETIILEKAQITNDYQLKIANSCKKIKIIQSTGIVHIPYIENLFDIYFKSVFSVELLQSTEGVECLTIENAIIRNFSVNLPSNIRRIALKKIETKRNMHIMFPECLEEITLEELELYAHFADFTIAPLLVRFKQGEFHSKIVKENNGMVDMMIQNAFFIEPVHFLTTVSSVKMSCVDFGTTGPLKLNANIDEISLNNCVGYIELGETQCLKIIELGVREFGFYVPGQDLCFKKNDNGESGYLYLSDLGIRETVHFGPEIEEFEFYNMTVCKSNHIEIHKNFKRIKISDCKGEFRIPGIFSDDTCHAINLTKYSGSLKIVKNNEESFAIFIRSLSFDKLVIEMNVDTARFFQVEIADLLLINSQQCNNLILDRFKGVISIPNVTSLNQLELSGLNELNISSEVIVTARKVDDMDTTPIHEDEALTVPVLHTNIHVPTILNDYCENIYVSECKFPINITGILTNITTNESVIQISPEEKFYLTGGCSEVPSKLELVNKQISGIFMIEKNVNFLSLAKITANEGSSLQLNKCLESVRVYSSEIDIDASNAKNLKAITLTNATSIVYNPIIHLLLSYLNISAMNVNHNFDLAPSVGAFLLKNCTITSDITVRINESISLLSISECEGLIDMTGVAGLRKMELNRQNTLYFDRCTGTSQGCLLQIENYTFKHGVVFSDDLETIRLKCVETAQGVELVLGQGCKHLELDSPKVAINPSCSMSLEKVTLKNTAFHDIKNLLTTPSRVKTLILEN